MKNDELNKRVIKIIGDYAFKNAAPLYVSEFSLYFAPLVVKAIEKNCLKYSFFKKNAKKYNSFFMANDLDVNRFCKDLYHHLTNELSFFTTESFYNTMVEFKRRVENGNYRGFPKTQASEDTLRSALSIYIDAETFCEARSSSGQSDIIIPSEKTIVETKIWNGREYFNSGIPELYDYLEKANYAEGYYIVFDYTRKPNVIIQTNGEVFDFDYQGKNIHVFFVLMNREVPSKLYKNSKLNN